MNRSLNHRRDYRSVEQFKEDIQKRTQKERKLLRLFIKFAKNQGHIISFRDFGIDNSGKLITKKTDCRPDYEITIDGETALYEIKSSPVDYKWTFKVYHMSEYVRFNSNILIFWNTGFKLEKLDRAYVGIITNEKIKQMLSTYPHYCEPKFGNKLCIQVPSADFKNWTSANAIC